MCVYLCMHVIAYIDQYLCNLTQLLTRFLAEIFQTLCWVYSLSMLNNEIKICNDSLF